MKREKWQRSLWAAVMGAMIAIGGIGCLATGMRLYEVSMVQVAVVCPIAAAFCAVCFQSRFRFVPVAAAAAICVLWNDTLYQSLECLIWHISKLYYMGYGWDAIHWSDTDFANVSVMPALDLIGGATAMAVAWTVKGRRSTFFAILPAALPVAVCVVLTDTVPREGYLFLFLLGVLLLLMTQLVRRASAAQGNKLTMWISLPLALLLGIMFLAIPQEGYTGKETLKKIEQTMAQWLEQKGEGLAVPTFPAKAPVYTDVNEEQVDLSRIGPQDPGMKTVMYVTAEENKVLYLRSSAYDTYDGLSWQVSQVQKNGDTAFSTPKSPSLSAKKTLHIRTVGVHETVYFTYNPLNRNDLQNGKIHNSEGVSEYDIQYGLLTVEQTTCQNEVDAQYSQLPEEVKSWAMAFLAARGLLVSDHNTPEEIRSHAEAIVRHVKSSARYDLGTARMPVDQENFVRWFLESSDTGYCVHFASAATVLLRAAGIPARYVTGYIVYASANQEVSVKEINAHAWVECYISGIGWVAMEPTASGEDSPIEDITISTTAPEDMTTGTEPAETETLPAQTEITQPTEQSEPSESSKPQNDLPDEETKEAVPAVLWWLAGVLAVLMMALGQWRLRLHLRNRKQHRGSANEQGLARWREALVLSKLLKQPPEETLHGLAQKARFSSHTLSKEELRRFDTWMIWARYQLRKRPVWYQILYTLVYAIY